MLLSHPITLAKPIVLIGMMGCGKSAIGALLAKELDIPFADADQCIESQMGMPVSQIFEAHGEPYFRQKEYEVIDRLLHENKQVIAVGGGAFIQPSVRTLIKQHATSIWIRAAFDILLERVSRKHHRPLLEKGDKGAILKALMEDRYPVYAEADMIIDTTAGPHEVVVTRIIEQLTKGLK